MPASWPGVEVKQDKDAESPAPSSPSGDLHALPPASHSRARGPQTEGKGDIQCTKICIPPARGSPPNRCFAVSTPAPLAIFPSAQPQGFPGFPPGLWPCHQLQPHHPVLRGPSRDAVQSWNHHQRSWPGERAPRERGCSWLQRPCGTADRGTRAAPGTCHSVALDHEAKRSFTSNFPIFRKEWRPRRAGVTVKWLDFPFLGSAEINSRLVVPQTIPTPPKAKCFSRPDHILR